MIIIVIMSMGFGICRCNPIEGNILGRDFRQVFQEIVPSFFVEHGTSSFHTMMCPMTGLIRSYGGPGKKQIVSGLQLGNYNTNCIIANLALHVLWHYTFCIESFGRCFGRSYGSQKQKGSMLVLCLGMDIRKDRKVRP